MNVSKNEATPVGQFSGPAHHVVDGFVTEVLTDSFPNDDGGSSFFKPGGAQQVSEALLLEIHADEFHLGQVNVRSSQPLLLDVSCIWVINLEYSS